MNQRLCIALALAALAILAPRLGVGQSRALNVVPNVTAGSHTISSCGNLTVMGTPPASGGCSGTPARGGPGAGAGAGDGGGGVGGSLPVTERARETVTCRHLHPNTGAETTDYWHEHSTFRGQWHTHSFDGLSHGRMRSEMGHGRCPCPRPTTVLPSPTYLYRKRCSERRLTSSTARLGSTRSCCSGLARGGTTTREATWTSRS